MTPSELKSVLGSGMLSFPVTDFKADGSFDEASYTARVEWLAGKGASALFVAGGTGEFFSIGNAEYDDIIRAGVRGSGSKPAIAGIGYGTVTAIDLARRAQAAGAAGVLVLPHYLIYAEQSGIVEHLIAICRSVDIGVIYYARDNSSLGPDALIQVAKACPNFIGYKDGLGDLQLMVRVMDALRDRLVYIGGLPTAEIFAQAYFDIGVSTYSSAVYNFVPELAVRFYTAVRNHDRAVVTDLLHNFYLPLIALRDRKKGYAVSMIKAGADLVGRPAGKVRSPLISLDDSERAILQDLIKKNA